MRDRAERATTAGIPPTERAAPALAALALLLIAGPATAQSGGRATPPANPATVGVVAPRPTAPSGHEPRVRPGRSLTAGRSTLGARPNVAHPPNVGGGTTVRHLPGPFTRLRVGSRIFFYCLGGFYRSHSDGYEQVPAPAGAVVRSLPAGAEQIELGGRMLWYHDGVFYEAGRRPGEYVVIRAPIGAIVSRLPEDAVEVSIRGAVHYEARGVTYVPVRREGEVSYVVTRS